MSFEHIPSHALTAQEADQQLRRIAQDRAALDAEEARWLRVAVSVGVHRQYGYATIFEYMERVLGHTPRAARDRLRVAEALAELPAIDDALATGRICYSAARELAHVAQPHTEGEWLARMQDCTLREIEEAVSGLEPGALPGDEPDPELRRHRLAFEVPAATFALFREARRHLEDEMGQALDEGELIAAMCLIVLGGPRDEGRANYQIALTTCRGCGRVWQEGAGQDVEVPETVIERALCDAQHIGRIDADKPVTARQDTSPATRRMVVRRDHGRCVVPGCRSARYLDVHHVVFRSDGGTNDPANLALLCGVHHDALHDGRLIMAGRPGAWTFTRADGQPYGARDPFTHVGEPAAARPFTHVGEPAPPPADTAREAYGALRHLGFRDGQARAALAHARTRVPPDAPLEVLLREALKSTLPAAVHVDS